MAGINIGTDIVGDAMKTLSRFYLALIISIVWLFIMCHVTTAQSKLTTPITIP
ncbi:MAG: hypothetical protein ABR936_17200 [Bacteroidota bacterium]